MCAQKKQKKMQREFKIKCDTQNVYKQKINIKKS